MTDNETKTLHCDCGNDTYKIKWEMKVDGDPWAVCAECDRPTSTVGSGLEKQRTWLAGEVLDELEEADKGDTILFDEAGGNVENLTESENDE